MAWTTPKTWVNEPLIAGDLNTHLRDNLEALKDPPSYQYSADELTDYSTTSSAFVEVDPVGFKCTLTTTGGDVMVGFHGYLSAIGNAVVSQLDISMDGQQIGGDDGIIAFKRAASGSEPTAFAVSFVRLLENVPAGSHTFALLWKTGGTSVTLFAGAGTSDGRDLHPQFWVREVS